MDTPDRLEALISAPRFATYVALASGDRDKAVELYHWTGAVAGGLMTDFRVLEVLLRNRIDSAMVTHLKSSPGVGEWYEDPIWVTTGNYLDQRATEAVERAKDSVREKLPLGAPISRGKVVAALSFGFWKRPTHARYEESFWLPALDQAFAVPAPNAVARREKLFDRLTVLNDLRNRVAHHEPICKPWQFIVRGGRDVMYPLAAQYRMLVDVIGWIDPAAGEWVKNNSTTLPLLVSPPVNLGGPKP